MTQALAGLGGADDADRLGEQLVVVVRALDEEVAALQPLERHGAEHDGIDRGWVASVAQVPISASKASRAGSRSVMSVGPSHRAELIDSGDSQGRLAVLQARTPTLLPIMPTISKLLRPRLSRLAPATAPAAPASVRTRRRPEAFDQPRPRAVTRRRALPFPELGALLLLAGVLNLWALNRNGWANEYYSAAVRSMSSSWHNFLYGSFDPSGLMTVDKPPLALWVQALSARVFGFHSLSILVPQALMGVATVALVYDLTRRTVGTHGRLRGRARARGHARSPSPSRATTTPTRCWRCAASAPCGASCARCRTAARAGSCWRACASASASRRRWAPRCSSCPRSSRPGCGSRRAAASPRCASCWPAAPRWSSSAARGRCS